ncbi:Hypothetical predicted protein [Octopus vulgaris]|uniref:Clusterin-associated protein 1 n=1 Tax=Octopus vulgaris TaxID=6645 RepID=A0AA36BGK8_OCTVU|nr:Hypothetical predicted protein [Octopus vulgaris]
MAGKTAIKSHLKLNSKKLYQADGYAVKELLKITSVLYNVMKTNEFNSLDDTESNESGPISFDISSKIVDLKEARKLASEITLKGATLYDLLAKEADLQESRSSVIARPLEINEVEKGINASMKIVQSDIQKTVAMLENIAADESTLDNKIEKRKIELDRNQKRLQTLQNVRPAYMDEYERLEQELEKLYEAYIIKFRNLTYLEQQLEEYSKMEQDKVKENQYALKSTAEALRQVERDPKNIFDEDDEDDDFSQTSDVLDSGSELDDSQVQRPIRPVHSRTRPEGASLTHSERKAHVQGSMFIDDSEDESGSDSDIDLDDNNEGDLDDDEDIEIAVKSKTAPGSAVLRHKMIEEDDDSDNDF